jgi:hypothetical protein
MNSLSFLELTSAVRRLIDDPGALIDGSEVTPVRAAIVARGNEEIRTWADSNPFDARLQ